MKESIIVICLFLAIFGCRKNKNCSKKNNEVEIVKLEVSLFVEKINNYKVSIDSIRFKLDSIQRDIYKSNEGGVVRVFYNKSDTLKKEVIYYGETGKRLVNIYQKQGKSVLIEDELINYTKPISVDKDSEIKNRTINVYYLDSQQNLVYWVKNNQDMHISLYKQQEKEIISDE